MEGSRDELNAILMEIKEQRQRLKTETHNYLRMIDHRLTLAEQIDESTEYIAEVEGAPRKTISPVLPSTPPGHSIKQCSNDDEYYGQIIHLNVGGHYYDTTFSTLTFLPDSMLGIMFSGRHNLITDSNGRYFIDRDGEYFRYVLNFLRQGELIIPGNDPLLKKAVMIEMHYFGLDSVASLVDPFRGTKLLSSEHQDIIKSWTAMDHHWVLIYRASEDGFTSSDFHRKCDGKGPTVTILESSSRFLFGGFTSISWDSSNGYKSDDKAFIFSLTNPFNYSPTKCPSGGDEYTINCNSSYGPVFGGGCDIFVSNNSNKNPSSSIGFPYSFLPTGHFTQTESFLGGRKFQLREIEVFAIE
eukprot:TRINITY_DN2137_c0_g1_i1.p1 TRINITY_DN2137_c0_g1~~TRINITY_DN2137_c0_g1_i1.p1  ORF type:complete len:356 (-),score=59.06 TRINITY_DN2137_c0_g1_i1:304-1371(-)